MIPSLPSHNIECFALSMTLNCGPRLRKNENVRESEKRYLPSAENVCHRSETEMSLNSLECWRAKMWLEKNRLIIPDSHVSPNNTTENCVLRRALNCLFNFLLFFFHITSVLDIYCSVLISIIVFDIFNFLSKIPAVMEALHVHIRTSLASVGRPKSHWTRSKSASIMKSPVTLSAQAWWWASIIWEIHDSTRA